MVNMNKLRLTVLQRDILRFLFMHAGSRFNARALAISLGVSQPAISKALPGLEKNGLVAVGRDEASGRLSIEFNRDNQVAIGMKRADNLSQLYESGFYDFLFSSFPGCAIVLFGSYSRGEDTWPANAGARSDIDIAIIGSKRKDVDLKKFEKVLEREIRINFYDSWKSIHRNLKNNLLGGVLLSGSVEI